MINIAVVDANTEESNLLTRAVRRYEGETGKQFHVMTFSDGFAFLECFESNKFDGVFIDPSSSRLNGLQTLKRLRRTDEHFSLIIISNHMQYALDGYDVNALGFVLKPLSYTALTPLFEKLTRQSEQLNGNMFMLRHADATYRLCYGDVRYIESNKHYLIYHTSRGEFKIRGSLDEAEQAFSSRNFVRCNKSYLVNMQYIESYNKTSVMVCGQELPVSRAKKSSFHAQLQAYFGDRIPVIPPQE